MLRNMDLDRLHLFLREMARPRNFVTTYRCYSISMYPGRDHQEVENGGKILLPPSALHSLTRLRTAYPMLFKLTNEDEDRSTHCGVLEFIAEEGKMYIPYWMMRNLLIDEGEPLKIESASLPVASFSKFQPVSSDFLSITNPKAVLENALRNFACLTMGDVIAIKYNNRILELKVLETRPEAAVNIIECDMNVEFEQPLDYVAPEKNVTKATENHHSLNGSSSTILTFPGSGQRVDGKACLESSSSTTVVSQDGGVPDYEFKIGQLTFARNIPKACTNNANEEKVFKPFEGAGTRLKEGNK